MRNHCGDYNEALLNTNFGCKKHIAYRALIPTRFSQAFLQENFTSKSVIDPQELGTSLKTNF